MNAQRSPCLSRPTNAVSLEILALLLLLFTNTFAHADNIYVSNGYPNNNTIERFDSSGNGTVFADASKGLSEPWGLAFDSSGNLYVANAINSTIEKFDSSGNGTVFANSNSGVNDPWGLAFDSSGNLYVANQGISTIEKFDSSGNGTVFANSNSGAGDCGWLAIDSHGNLYATTGFHTITKFNSSGVGSVFADASSGLSVPGCPAFDSSGNLYVPNGGYYNYDGSIYYPSAIVKFDANGNASVFATSSLSQPSGLAFDSSGNLYEAFGDSNTIEKFDSSGNGTIFADASEGLAYPLAIAVQPVPEPATWVFVAMGLLALTGKHLLRRS